MGLYMYLTTTSNILDLYYDLFTYLTHTYPSLFTNVETFFHLSGSLVFDYMSIILQAFHTVFNFKYLNSAVFNTGFKFILLIALLVFVRGGIPRYRFDFLTKIG